MQGAGLAQRPTKKGTGVNPMIRLINDGYIRAEIDGNPLKRCEEIIKGEEFDESKVVSGERFIEYSGDYEVIVVGENCKLVLRG